MQGRILKEKLKDTNGMRQGRSCSIKMLINLKIVTSNSWSLNLFFSPSSIMCMYIQECYAFICTLCMPRNFIVVVQFSSVRYVPVIIDEEEQWRLVPMFHEDVGTTVEAKAMSGHFGRDKTVSLLTSKVYFPGITNKVKQFVESCEACQHVKAGSKFEKGGDKLKSVHVPHETWTQLGINLITNLPVTPEGYNTIVTCIDYTSKSLSPSP